MLQNEPRHLLYYSVQGLNKRKKKRIKNAPKQWMKVLFFPECVREFSKGYLIGQVIGFTDEFYHMKSVLSAMTFNVISPKFMLHQL